MSSSKAKQEWTRGKKYWNFGPKEIVILGFIWCIKVSNTVAEDSVCMSNACSLTASTILKNMNPTVEPCDDFYDFACGGFVNSTIIPSNALSMLYTQILDDEIRENLTRTIAREIEPNEPKFFKLAKKLYKSCMNPGSSGAQGLHALKKLLNELGGWPVLDGETWDETKFDWRQMINKFHTDGNYHDWTIGDGVGHLIGCRIYDHRRLPKRLITLTQPAGLLPHGVKEDDFNQVEPFLREYYNFLVNLAVQLGADIDRASMELRETLSFEIKLANIKSSDEESTVYNPMTIGELNKIYSSVPWIKYIKKFVPTNINVTDDEIIDVQVPEYYVKLEDLMSNTPKRVQANYVFSRVAIRNAVYSNEEMRQSVYNYLSSRHKIRLDLNRTKWCTNQIMQNFKLGISGIYARNYFDEEARSKVTAMTMKIKHEARNKLLQNTWMDVKTKRAAIKKSDDLVHSIGYPNEIIDDKELDKYYENLEFDEKDFFANMNNLSAFDITIGFKRLREPVMKNDWRNHYPSTTANAVYSPLRNSIEILAGLLHGLYFDKNQPNYLNYGAIGSTIGHEITHCFYEEGKYFDHIGKQKKWWEPLTETNFQNRSQCIIEQYKNYVDNATRLRLNGAITLTENVADIGGVRLAYDTYKKWAGENVAEPKLPGLEKYSAAQMFWISKASVECAKYDLGTHKREIDRKTHATNKFRVNGPLSNMPEFTEDFQCQQNARMNPEKKCSVW